MRSQFVTANLSKIRFTPYAFTEYGVSMLANILNSNKAVRISVEIIRAFIQLRQYAIAQTMTVVLANDDFSRPQFSTFCELGNKFLFSVFYYSCL
ncbi:MAG: ORF6N domain-containing protein [Candidatus Gastranaerophilales bacterium]|nr:ORF6N domain-containing protein [Candidatus Gastranaerophilales bacterium]